MFKKVFSLFVSIFLIINSLGVVHAALTMDTDTFHLSHNGGSYANSDVYAKPGDNIRFFADTTLGGGDATNPKATFTFSSSQFTYDNTSSTIDDPWGAGTTTPIPTSNFNPPTDNEVLLKSGTSWNFDYLTLNHIKITINSNASDTSNEVSVQFHADGYAGGSSQSHTIYIDVKPHVTAASFSKAAINNGGSDSTDLTVEVKDFNGCSNLSSVTANLSSLGYTTSEALTLVSCSGDTATYEKTGITTTTTSGVKTITITATDSDGNTNDANDANFGSIDLADSSVDLTVNEASAPEVTSLSTTDDYIGSPSENTTTLNWALSGDTEEYKVIVGNYPECDNGTILQDWTTTLAATIGVNESDLSVGSNTITVCAKKTGPLIGSASVNVTKDSTAPTLTKDYVGPQSITSESVIFRWKSNEIGTYDLKVGSTSIGTGSYSSANTLLESTFDNGDLALGTQTIYVEFTDRAGFTQTLSESVTKEGLPPDMDSITPVLADNDSSYDGIDGRDFTVTWTKPAESPANSYSYFGSYRVYILPQGTSLDTSTHTSLGIVNDIDTLSITLSELTNNDSAGNAFTETNYNAYVLAIGNSGAKGASSNASNTLSYTNDVVSHPSLVSASFISDTILKLTYDSDLSTTTGDHNPSNILSDDFTIDTSCNSNGVNSINGTTIQICINSLGDITKKVSQIGQIDSVTPASVEIGDQFTFTIGAVQASYTAVAATVGDVVSGLTSAINTADFTPEVASGITATAMDGNTWIKIKPDYVSTTYTGVVASTDGGGTDTQTITLRENMENAIKGLGGFNCHSATLSGCTVADSSLAITDGQTPSPITISALSPTAGTFFSGGTVTLDFSFPEKMRSDSYLKIERTGGDSDANSPHTISLNSYTASGTTHQITLDPTDLKGDSTTTTTDILNSSTYYKFTIFGYDLAGNTNSSFTGSIKYDTDGPSAPVLVPYPNGNEDYNISSNTGPVLTWVSATDNTNGSGLKEYEVQISTGSNFSVLYQTGIVAAGTESFTGNLSAGPDGTFYWRARGVDQVGNTGSWSTTSDFILNSSYADIFSITFDSDRPTSNTIYETAGRTLIVKALIGNGSGSCMRADLSGIGLGAAVAVDTYDGTTATWTGKVIDMATTEGPKSITINALNEDCLAGTTGSLAKSLIIDNTAPSIGAGLTYPLTGNVISGAGTGLTTITWDQASLTDTNPDKIKLEYYSGSWLEIASNESNDGSHDWDAPDSITSSKLRLTFSDKAGNETVQTGSTFVIDSGAPVLGAALTYPIGGESFAGGTGLTITWSGAVVTASDPNLKTNPITLYYSLNSGTSWTQIATGEANDGNYSWTVPTSTDLSTAQIKLEVEDLAGNIDSVASADFSIDSTKPTATSIKTLDQGGTVGKIDGIEITFSENVANVNTGSITVAGYTVDGSSSPSADKLILNLTEIAGTCDSSDQSGCDSGARPNVSLAATSVTDSVGNEISLYSVNATDSVKPKVLGRVTKDANGDGTLDGIEISFSENMNAAGITTSDFSLTTSAGTSLTETYNNSQANDTTILLGFSNGTSFDTGDLSKSQITTTNFKDINGNSLSLDGSAVSSTDGASPIFRANTQGTSSSSQIKVEFSENVNISSTGTWVLSGGLITISSTSTGANSITFDTSSISDTGLTPSVEYSSTGSISDSAGNAAITGSVTASDSMKPEINSIITLDSDSNGKIDSALLVFSENIDDSTVTASDFAIGGIATNSVTTGTGNDNQTTIELGTEISGTDTKDVTYTAGALADTAGNTLDSIASGDVTETDGAGPAIVSAYYTESGTTPNGDTLVISFSENIDDSTLDTVAGNSDLEFTVAGGGSIANATTTSGTVDDKQITITLAAADTALVPGVSTVAFVGAGLVDDGQAVSNSQISTTTVAGSLIFNEIQRGGMNGNTSDQYIELRNLSSSSAIDFSSTNYVVCSGSTVVEILSAGTLAADGYFLLSNLNQVTSKLNIAPDVIGFDNAMRDGTNLSLTLRTGNDCSAGQVVDTAWDSTAANLGGNNTAMERSSNPRDGSLSTNWYAAVNEDTGFDSDANTYKGTPGAANVLDATPPTLTLASRSPAPNTLVPDTPTISLDYLDGETGVDTSAVQVFSGSCSTGTDISGSATITTTNVKVNHNALPRGKNTVCIKVVDNAGNSSEASWDFRIDNFTFQVTEVSPAELSVQTGVAEETAGGVTKLTLTTYGAGLDVTGTFPSLSGVSTISQNDFFYDSKLDKNSVEQHTYNGYLDATNTTVESIAKETDLVSNPGLKTYEIYLKYQLDVSAIQAAGNYNGNVSFGVDLTY